MANPTTRHEHVGGAAPASLTTSMSAADLAFSISTNTGWPTGGVGTFYIVIDPGTFSEEKILCSAQSTSLVTVASGGRGADGTTARTHAIGAVTYPCWTAAESDELNLHAASTTAVHGVAGAVVGTTDAQALTNKTIASASNTINVTGGAIDTVLAGKQPLGGNLTALTAFNTNGLMTQTTAGAFTARSIAVSGAGLSVTNPLGTAGNPTVTLTPANITGVLSTNVTAPAIPALNVFTATGSLAAATVTGAKALRVWARGTGGSGGGCPTTGATQVSGGSGGGQGAWVMSVLDIAAVTFPVTVTVPAAPTGTIGAAGTAGTDVSFGTYVIAKPGQGGQVGPAGGAGSGYLNGGGAGGLASTSTGQFKEDGAAGNPAQGLGSGLAVIMGAGGGSGATLPLNFNSTPGTPVLFGAGGHGAANLPSQGAAKTGGTAMGGYIVVEPIY